MGVGVSGIGVVLVCNLAQHISGPMKIAANLNKEGRDLHKDRSEDYEPGPVNKLIISTLPDGVANSGYLLRRCIEPPLVSGD
jgi:hypothetical protein